MINHDFKQNNISKYDQKTFFKGKYIMYLLCVCYFIILS